MFLKRLKSLFTHDSIAIQKADDVGELIGYLNYISNGIGEYAFSVLNEKDPRKKNKKAQEMLSIITDIEEKSVLLNNSLLLYSLSIAYRNYCKWFVRGDARKEYLEKCVTLLYRSISLSADNIESKAELGRLLIEERLVRNLSKGIELLEQLNRDDKLPSYLNSILAKAYRQLGNIEIEDFNLCAFKDPSPAVFDEERKRFRALIRKYKKEQEIDKLKVALTQYYNLAVLETVIYGANAPQTDAEEKETVKMICDKIDCSFMSHGYLTRSNFISKNDWKTFVEVFGENSKNFDPVKEYKGK